MTNSFVQFSFLDVGTPFFFSLLVSFLEIYTTHTIKREPPRSDHASIQCEKKEIRRIKVNRPGRRKKKMMISHHCFQFWKETSSHFIRYFAIGPRRSIKKNKRNGIRKSTLPPCFSSFVLLLSSLFFLVVSSKKKTLFSFSSVSIFLYRRDHTTAGSLCVLQCWGFHHHHHLDFLLFLLFILLLAPLFLHVKLLCNYREDVGFSEQRGIPRFLNFFLCLDAAPFFHNSFFLCISSSLRFSDRFLFFWYWKTTMTTNEGPRFFFINDSSSFNGVECQKWGDLYVICIFLLLLALSYWKLRDYCPLPIITLCDSLIFWQRYLKEESPYKVSPKIFLFFSFLFWVWIWICVSGRKGSSSIQNFKEFLFWCTTIDPWFLFSMRESSKNKKVMEGITLAGGSCKDANVVEFFHLFGGG